jgi:hypothetical protein
VAGDGCRAAERSRAASPTLRRVGLVLLVASLAAVLRVHAVRTLPIDFDEDNYLRAAQQYQTALQTGNWTRIYERKENFEHPPLAKLAFGIVLLALPRAPEVPAQRLSAPPANDLPRPQLVAARLTAATFGVAAVLALSLVDPIGGAALAVSTWNIKYTSEVYLEALAALFALLAVVFYVRSRRIRGAALAGSAVMVGLAGATKYVYAVVGVAILADWFIESSRRRASWSRVTNKERAGDPERRRSARALAPWVVLVVAVFLVADFWLWPDPVGRLAQSLAWHEVYATGASVRAAGLPPWQPIVWLTEPVPWHQGAFVGSADLAIALLSLLGAARAWIHHRVFALWLLLGLVFLVAWPTKWPQYTVVLTAPLSVIAADGARTLRDVALEVGRRVSGAQRATGPA